MCQSLRLYKCGTCASCYSSKRNGLAIRLKEHYNGYLRHFEKNQYAILFGMLTFDEAHLPEVDYNADIVCKWQPPVQLFVKSIAKLYPFLHFEYFVSAEVGEQGRLHLHPIFFVKPKDVHPLYKGATLTRFNDMIRALADKNIYKVKMLKSRKKKRPEFVDFTAFELYVRNIVQTTWISGISSLSPILSSKGIVYATKYMTKSRNIIFRRRVWLSDDATRKSSHFVTIGDPLSIYSRPQKLPTLLDSDVIPPRSKKRFYKYIYKSYLISRGIGDYFYETPQWLSLLNNFSLVTKPLLLDSQHKYNVTYTPSLKWYDEVHAHNTLNNGYSLPLKYRKHLYDLIAPIDTPERDLISSAGYSKLYYSYIQHLISLCQSNNLPYTISDTDFFGLPSIPKISIPSYGMEILNNIQKSNYNSIQRFKQFLYDQKSS